MRGVSILLCSILVGACGGGGDSSAPVGTAPPPPSAPATPAATGSVSSPKTLVLDAGNPFGADPFFNNFKYDGSLGERLVIRANLSTPMSDTQSARCASNPGYPTRIVVSNSSGAEVSAACSEELTFTFPAAGTYLFNFYFPDNGGGTFYAASLKGASPVQFSDSGDGSPSRPRKLSTVAGNSIASNPFYNYYWVQLAQGETLVLGVQLLVPLTQTQKTRCAANAEGTNNAQLRMFNATLNQVAVVCGEGMQFVAPATGTYVVRTDYGVNGGTLNAARR